MEATDLLLARALALAGEEEAATTLLAEIDATDTQVFPRAHGLALQARSWVHAMAGDLGRAVECSLLAGAALRDGAHAGLEAYVVHDLVRFGRPTLARPRLAELACEQRPRVAQEFLAHAVALDDLDVVALGEVAERFAAGGLDVSAAEAAVEASRIAKERGERQVALRLAARAREFVTGVDGPPTPALRDRPQFLTRRESEVAMLAARGHSSRLIAQRLGITVRTVQNLLQRVYEKLDVHRRADLAPIVLSGEIPDAVEPAAGMSNRMASS